MISKRARGNGNSEEWQQSIEIRFCLSKQLGGLLHTEPNRDAKMTLITGNEMSATNSKRILIYHRGKIYYCYQDIPWNKQLISNIFTRMRLIISGMNLK